MRWILLVLAVLFFAPSGNSQTSFEPINIEDSLNSDLRFLDDLLKDKQIILLGEFSHGVKELNILKNKIIRYLHDKHDFDVLLLETGIAEANIIDKEGIMGPWRTREHEPLISYLKDNPDLNVAGFDPQKSGRTFSLFIDKLFLPRHSAFAIKLKETEKLNDSLLRIIQRNDTTYDIISFRSFVKARYISSLDDIASIKDVDKEAVQMIVKSMENRIAYLNYYSEFRNKMSERFYARDSLMAENIHWLLTKQYPGKKAIIIAHNYHISKYNEYDNVMGERLYAKFKDKMYAIGMFGGSGAYADNSRKPKQMMDAVGNDLKTIILSYGADAGFIDLSKDKKGIFNNPFVVNDTFTDLKSTNQMDLKKSFDGIIFIRQVSPGVY